MAYNDLPLEPTPPAWADSDLLVNSDSKITRWDMDNTDGDVRFDITKRLAHWAIRMRDELIPRYHEGILLHEASRPLVMKYLDKLMDYDMPADILRLSRIHFALLEMNASDAWWDKQSSNIAQLLLIKWESKFGNLKQLREDIWDVGGPMANVAKVLDSSSGTLPKGLKKSDWSILRPPGKMALTTGDLNFPIGSWWIKPAAAYRDGIIENLGSITANEKEAFALVMNRDDELDTSTPAILNYIPDPTIQERVKLMQNIITHNPVRVLRSCKSKSQWSPKAGLRYDGLYTVTKYSVKSQAMVDNPLPVYTFTLTRLEGQSPLETALYHPTSHEMDDWGTYQMQKSLHLITRSDIDMNRAGQVVLPGSPNTSTCSSGMSSGHLGTHGSSPARSPDDYFEREESLLCDPDPSSDRGSPPHQAQELEAKHVS